MSVDATDNGLERGPGRREFLALGVGAFAVALAPGVLRSRARLVRRSVPAMGTVAELAVVHRDERFAHRALDAAVSALMDVERSMTRFRADSDIGRANLGAAADAVTVSPDTARVVAAALRWAERTEGRFDPAVGRLVAAWDVGRRTAPPAHDLVARFADRHLYRAVEVGTRHGQDVLRFHDADVALDLGGIAKGFGVDRAIAALRDWGIRDAIVNVGGDLYAAGVSPGEDPWRVGIRSSEDPYNLDGTLEVRDQAVATSGDYEQSFVHQGRRYHHLLDPVTAEPRRVAVHSLTILAHDCTTADAAATALFGMHPTDASRRLASLAPGAILARAG